MRSAEGHEAIEVEIVRRAERHHASGAGLISEVGETHVLVAGLRLTVDEALRLARLVTAATDLVDAPF